MFLWNGVLTYCVPTLLAQKLEHTSLCEQRALLVAKSKSRIVQGTQFTVLVSQHDDFRLQLQP